MRVCVFCGSSDGNRPAYREIAATVGRALAERSVSLVYGGGRAGCMGALADAALAAHGEVIGVIPESLATREVAHAGLTALHLVASMHERKALMASKSDAFLALPGGFGTLEELFEVVTWRQLGYHDKPIGIVNVDGYFDGLLDFCDRARDTGFVRPEDRAALRAGTDAIASVDELLARARRGIR
jgi:uncharacterized protein (TIGR00730 family)